MGSQRILHFAAVFIALFNASRTQNTQFRQITTGEQAHTRTIRQTDLYGEIQSSNLSVDLPTHNGLQNGLNHERDFLSSPLRHDANAAILTYLARARRMREEPHFPEGLTCDICEFLVGEIRSLVQAQQTIEEILAGAAEVCAVTRLVNRDICRMVVQEYQVGGAHDICRHPQAHQNMSSSLVSIMQPSNAVSRSINNSVVIRRITNNVRVDIHRINNKAVINGIIIQ
ncbi:hypothetical protein EGW08_008284 [Elysia chlorotica]|uniref:Saposin B-type domain-containing protein n=1 Tax=Elysia chlorotica TaxID=188477 RepID=A0A433TQN8_ELYCH|nr:hypothetical protein EGW08_008284 [Elysia chlorotica]